MSPAPPQIEWYLARDGKQHGPVSDTEMQKLVELGHLKPTDLVWRQGLAEWSLASAVFAPKPAAAPPPPPVVPPPQPHAVAEPAPHTAPAPEHPAGPATRQAAPHGQPQRAQPVTTDPYARAHPKPQPQAQPQAQPEPRSRPMAASPETSQHHYPSHPSELGRGQPAPVHHQSAAPMPVADPIRPAAGPQTPADLQSPSWPAAVRQPAGGARRNEAPTHVQPQAAQGPRPIDADEDRGGRRKRGWGRPIAAVGVLVLLAIGGKFAWDYRERIPFIGAARVGSVTEASPETLRVQPFKSAGVSAGDVDLAFQQSALWQVIKREFPEWYADRVKETLALRSQNRDEQAIAKHLIEAVVGLRRKHAEQALAASPARLRFVATSFLENLQQLAKHSTDACYGFISQGETSGTVLPLMENADLTAALQKQVTAVIEAAADGRKTPQAHLPPRKTDYDTLAQELTRLGWSQADLQLFSDPRALARASPAQVCKMVQDWFAAQVAIKDRDVQVRLLVESLRPVVAG